MKIKTDFITNSSSCAYIMFGVILKQDEFCKKLNIEIDDLYEEVEEKFSNFDFNYGSDCGLEDNQIIIGKIVADHIDEEFESCLTPFSELIDVKNQLEKELEKYDINCPECELFAGVRCC